MTEGEFDEKDAVTLSAVLGCFGVAHVRAFGLTWADREDLVLGNVTGSMIQLDGADITSPWRDLNILAP